LKIARNVYLGHLRKLRKHTELEDTHPDPAPGPEKSVEFRSELGRIQTFLKTLPEIDRSAFVIRIKYEIARILQISEAAARVKVHRVRKKLIANRMDEEAT